MALVSVLVLAACTGTHECGHRGLPVVWGVPRPGDLTNGDEGKVYMGGCVLGGFTRWCPKCQVGFAVFPDRHGSFTP